MSLKKLAALNRKFKELDVLHSKQVNLLENISGISKKQAKTQLVESLKAEAQTDAMAFIQNSIEEAKMTADIEAKKSLSVVFKELLQKKVLKIVCQSLILKVMILKEGL